MALQYPNEGARQAVAGTLAWIPWIAVPRLLVAALMSFVTTFAFGPHGGIGLPGTWTAGAAFVACWWFIVESGATAWRASTMAAALRSVERVSPDAVASSRRERYRWGVFFELLALVGTLVGPFVIEHPVAVLALWLSLALGVRLCRTRVLIKSGILDGVRADA